MFEKSEKILKNLDPKHENPMKTRKVRVPCAKSSNVHMVGKKKPPPLSLMCEVEKIMSIRENIFLEHSTGNSPLPKDMRLAATLRTCAKVFKFPIGIFVR